MSVKTNAGLPQSSILHDTGKWIIYILVDGTLLVVLCAEVVLVLEGTLILF